MMNHKTSGGVFIYLICIVVIFLILGGIWFLRSAPPTSSNLPTPLQSESSPLTSTSSQAPVSQSSTLGGIYVVKELSDSNPRFNDQVFTNPSISGAAPRVSWKDLEPSRNQFNWDSLDTIFQKAQAHNKQVVIIPVSGFDSPAWALEGAQSAQFPRKYGKGAGELSTLPLPWDQTYLNNWYSFLEALSQRYSDNPAFVMIGTSGPTSVSVEMSLPNTDQDLQKWISLGFTPSRYLQAWKQTFAMYAKLFPKQHFSLALYPGLPINENSQIDQSQSLKTRQAVIDLGTHYPHQFALQTSGLNASKSSGGGYEIVLGYNGQIATGFQMSTSATNNPTKMGDSQNPAHGLQLSIEKGASPNQSGARIKYLEVYEPDIVNPDMQGVLSYGQTLLRQGTATPPTLPEDTPKKDAKTSKTRLL